MLAEAWGTGAPVRNVRRLSGGASRHTWAADVAGPDGADAGLVFQLARPGAMRPPGGMVGEAKLLRTAAAAGVPVADVVAAGDDTAGPLGAPYLVMGRVEGETIARRILRDEALAGARARLAGDCGRALAALHAIDPSSLPALAEVDPVAQARQVLDGFADVAGAHPAFELGFRWLEANRPAAGRQAVVHGDFRNGNLVVGGDGLRAVLDWELAHVGDPLEDLGWLCVRAWRFGAAPPVGGFGERRQLYDAYADAGGVDVDETAAHWWEVMGTLRWGTICVVQAAGHLHGMTRSVELAAIGRRVCETEHDLLLLLPRTSAPPTSAPPTTFEDADGAVPLPKRPQNPTAEPPHDRPTAAELLGAVREFLSGDVAGALDPDAGRVAFHLKVADRVLAMVERELALGPVQRAAHRARLDALGFADDAALAEAIRAGDLDDRYAEVKAAVWATVADKLAVANPRYADEAEA